MRRFFLAVVATLALLASADAPAQQAETRIALIIANETYASPNLGRLPGTARDAELMRAALQRAGFDVTVRRNLGRTDMRNALLNFARQLGQLGENGVGFLYYSGHGIADDPNGRNYLIPVDADIAAITDLPIMGLLLNEQLESIELAHAKATVIVIDACRNTPISFNRSNSRGLAPVSAATDTLVAFSTQPGAVAADDSIYAQVLADELGRPGADSAAVFQRVQSVVVERTARRQRPRYDNGLSTPVVFVPGAPSIPNSSASTLPVTAARIDAIRALLAPVSLAGDLPSQELQTELSGAGDAVYFNPGEARLTAEAQHALDGLARWIIARSNLRVRAVGNADERESEDPVLLGAQRAKAVRDYLVGAGVAPDRIGSTTFGLDEPADPRSNEEAWARGRSVLVRIVGVVGVLRPPAAPGEAPRIRSFRDCPTCPELVRIPAGRYMMGSPATETGREADEGPQREVRVRAFAAGRYEVTRAEFSEFIVASGHSATGTDFDTRCPGWRGGSGAWDQLDIPQTDLDPVVCVSARDARAYLAWLSQRTERRYRFLTEEEWEYAARAGSAGRFWWGEGEPCAYANVGDALIPGYDAMPRETCSDAYAYTAPVGSYRANSFGLSDIIGNAAELVSNCYAPTYGSACWTSIVFRGGSWSSTGNELRSASRSNISESQRSMQVGFRVARDL